MITASAGANPRNVASGREPWPRKAFTATVKAICWIVRACLLTAFLTPFALSIEALVIQILTDVSDERTALGPLGPWHWGLAVIVSIIVTCGVLKHRMEWEEREAARSRVAPLR